MYGGIPGIGFWFLGVVSMDGAFVPAFALIVTVSFINSASRFLSNISMG